MARGMAPVTRFTDLASSALVATIGVSLLVATWPRLVAFTTALPGDPVILDIRNQREVTHEEVGKLIETHTEALSWYRRGRTLSDLALAHMVRANMPEASSRRMGELLLAERYVMQSLNSAPMNPYAWVRLSALWSQLHLPPKHVVSALMTSIRFSRVSKTLWRPRVQLLLAYWEHLNEAQIRVAVQQIAYGHPRYAPWLKEVIVQSKRQAIAEREDLAFLRSTLAG
jgi:hypothetical protein